ncbi:ABC transporter permease [Sinomicrobium weinanense]|uniref:ABC transporter permease n=1 Tax=Sinomicrobium weinanense TaxID=2842200 RepID=A0A926Q4K1_9FLAO|nr:FtsX-like permease family protein [Sinomicrobium weinanense]MBC9798637.1 ABC transporter permease [Sinomicrobium weinanense]MBU3122801.1 ABC transporter permease [Sinomicrobium weinanense]
MNIYKLGIKNALANPLSTLLSTLLLVLSIGLISLMLQITRQLDGKLERNIKGVDMVIGAKGSPLQLVLSSVLHIDVPTGNIKLKDAEKIARNPLVKQGIPVSYGDNYKGYRILGTEKSFLELYGAEPEEGRLWEKPFEVVIGATVSEKLGLTLGSTFSGSHGLMENSTEAHDHHPFTVVGILKPGNTVADQLIIGNLESVWLVHQHGEEEHDGAEEHGDAHDHDHSGHEHEHDIPEEDREITSMLVKFKNPMAMVRLPRMINENTNMQAALPNYEVERLFNLLNAGSRAITLIAVVIMLVSGISIFVNLYKAVRERKYEMALLRTYGASRLQLLLSVMVEGLLIGVTGFVAGILFSRLGMWILSGYVEDSYRYTIGSSGMMKEEVFLFIFTVLLTIFATVLAAVPVFYLNVSKILAKDD